MRDESASRPSRDDDFVSSDEGVLIAAATRGDTGAFRELYQANAETVFGYLHARAGFHEAEDMTAEVFCRAWGQLAGYQWRGVPFRAWLLTIAKNLIRSRARRAAVLTITPSASGELREQLGTAADERALRSIDAVAIRRALEDLKPTYRSVLRLRFLEELTVKEASERLGCSEENVRIRTFRALADLRDSALGALA